MEVYVSKYILVINPGSTSTKISIFDGERELIKKTISHSLEELAKFDSIISQYEMRKKIILKTLREADFNIMNLKAVVGRGGLLKSIPGGTYEVNQKMIEDLKTGVQGEHASNLGGILAFEIAKETHVKAFIVDPVVVDELIPLARYSGHPDIKRRSIFHALNQRFIARRVAEEKLKSRYEDVNIIVAHLGGGISIGMHSKGKVIDVNNALNGDGPFAPERTGGLPAFDLVKYVMDNNMTLNQVKKMLAGRGGIVAYLKTNDMKEVEEMVNNGDTQAKEVIEAMAYQVSKEIGGLSATVKGKVDAIALSGGLAYFKDFISSIKERVSFIAPIYIYPGGDEMQALAQGAYRVIQGKEKAKHYE